MEKKYNLDAPAFGPDAQKAEETSEATSEVSQTKEVVQDKKELVTPKEEVSEEEQKIPYSRFKTISDRARQAEQEAQEARERYDNLLSERERRTVDAKPVEDEKVLDYFIKMYGDNDNTREAYKLEMQRIAYIEKRAEEKALESLERARTEEVRALRTNEQIIDNNLESLTDYLGRQLTESEELGILEIVDEYTPKDEDGNYSGDLMSFDKAYELYELRNQVSNQASKKARSTVTRLTGSNTEGEPSGQEKSNKDFNPLDWGAYRNRV